MAERGAFPYMPERLDLRLPEGVKERWKAQADAQSLTLTEYVVRRVESDRLAGVIRSEIKAGFQRLESLVTDRLATPPSHEASLIPSRPRLIFPKPAHGDNFDIHVVGAICGGNGLPKPAF
jgi:hypothetical protein